MSTYVALVDDPDFKGLSAEARLLFWTLKHWPEGNKVGIFAAFPDALMDRSGLGRRALNVAKEELKAARVVFWDGNIAWIRNHLRFSPELAWKNEKQMAGLRNEILGLPKTSLLNDFIEHYKGLRIPIEWDSIPSSTKLSVATLSDPTRPEASGAQAAAAPSGRRRIDKPSADLAVYDTPENRAVIDAYNATFGTRVTYTPGNLRACKRAYDEGYVLAQFQAVFDAVRDKRSDTAKWCSENNREFEYLIRPSYRHFKTQEFVQGPLDKITNELATGRRAG